MNYPELKRSHDEMTDAIERHNEQVSKEITEKVFGNDIDERAEAVFRHEMAKPDAIAIAQQRQSKLIQQALEALHLRNYDDVKKILELL